MLILAFSQFAARSAKAQGFKGTHCILEITGVLHTLTYQTLYTMLMLTISKSWRAPHPRIALLMPLLIIHYC
jgi:hypothetical protein